MAVNSPRSGALSSRMHIFNGSVDTDIKTGRKKLDAS